MRVFVFQDQTTLSPLTLIFSKIFLFFKTYIYIKGARWSCSKRRSTKIVMISAVVMNVVQSSILMTIVQLLSIVRMAIWILRIIVLRIGTWKESIAIHSYVRYCSTGLCLIVILGAVLSSIARLRNVVCRSVILSRLTGHYDLCILPHRALYWGPSSREPGRAPPISWGI